MHSGERGQILAIASKLSVSARQWTGRTPASAAEN
jgi:hypothetical protein